MASVGTALFVLIATGSLAQDSFQRVDIRDLQRNPQRYWARGLVFEDVLTGHPRGSTIRVEDRTYERLSTETLGTVYATTSAAEKLRTLPLQKTYLFSGTVLQQDAGLARRWMRGSPDFIHVVQDVSVPVEAYTEAVADMEAMQAAVLEAEEAAVPSELVPVMDVLRAVERGLFTFAQENDIDVAELFDPESEFAEMPARLALQEIRRMERAQGFSVQLFLADYSIGLLRRRYRPDAPIHYSEVRPLPAEPEEEPIEIAAAPAPPRDEWADWFQPAPEEEPSPTVPPPEEEPTVAVAEPEPPATLRIEGERTEELIPEPIEDETIAIDDAEVEPDPPPAAPSEEIETFVMETAWEAPASPVEVPIVVDPDLDEFPGLHDEIVSRPWRDELALLDVEEDEFELDRWIDAIPETEPDPMQVHDLPLEQDIPIPDVEERDAPEVLPFPVPGVAAVPEPEPAVPPPSEAETKPRLVRIGPFQLPFPDTDFLLDPHIGLTAE